MLTQFLTQTAHNIQHNIVTKAPKILAFPTQYLPFSLQHKCLQEALSRVFEEAIEDGDIDFLEDKWLQVRITDLNLTWFLSFKDGKFLIQESAQTTDVSFSALVNDLILIAGRKEDPDTLFFQRRLSIEGDTELGLEVKNLLDNIEFDKLPTLAQQGLAQFSSFVQTGLIPPKTSKA